MFDWLQFLAARNIPYREHGEGVVRNNVIVHCPMCGAETPNDYMSVSLEGKGWRCWRRPQHSGIAPARLVRALLGCSWEQALLIAGQRAALPSDVLSRVTALLSPSTEVEAPERRLKLPSEFKPIKVTAGFSRKPLFNYLDSRRFNLHDIEEMTQLYGVHWCDRGAYNNRIIFPVVVDKRLVSWTGRHISPNQTLRYKTLSANPEKSWEEGYPPALGVVNHYLLWRDLIKDNPNKCDTLCIVEGPFDALKINVLGNKSGIQATCLFTNRPTRAQIDLLYEILPKYKRRLLILDRGTLGAAMQLSSDLRTLGLKSVILPDDIKDPGDLDMGSFQKIFCL